MKHFAVRNQLTTAHGSRLLSASAAERCAAKSFRQNGPFGQPVLEIGAAASFANGVRESTHPAIHSILTALRAPDKESQRSANAPDAPKWPRAPA